MSSDPPTQDQATGEQLARSGRDAAEETEPVGDALRTPGPRVSIEGYEMIRELHRGGQGVVYEALEKAAKRKVAIKVLVTGRFAPKTARKRFEREIELVAQLKHSNIISIFHSGETSDGLPFFVMDYVRGRRLDHYVRERKLTLEETLNLFSTVCDAVQRSPARCDPPRPETVEHRRRCRRESQGP